jgi:exodeoxyribonuclease-3
MPLTLATWNVNSLKVRLNHLLDWLATHRVDVVCLQETKLIDEHFPVAALADAGYDAVFAGQKTYNGVALLTRRATMPAAVDVVTALPGFEDRRSG